MSKYIITALIPFFILSCSTYKIPTSQIIDISWFKNQQKAICIKYGNNEKECERESKIQEKVLRILKPFDEKKIVKSCMLQTAIDVNDCLQKQQKRYYSYAYSRVFYGYRKKYHDKACGDGEETSTCN